MRTKVLTASFISAGALALLVPVISAADTNAELLAKSTANAVQANSLLQQLMGLTDQSSADAATLRDQINALLVQGSSYIKQTLPDRFDSSGTPIFNASSTTPRPMAPWLGAQGQGGLIATSSIPRPSSPPGTSVPPQDSIIEGTPFAGACTTNRTLDFGARGNDVRAVQTQLIAGGYLGAGNDTGYFGPLTRSAVQRFQANANIVSGGDPRTTGFGRVGPRTLSGLGCDLSGSPSSTAPLGAPSWDGSTLTLSTIKSPQDLRVFLYYCVLGRSADAGPPYLGTISQLYHTFFDSSEYTNKYKEAHDYVKDLYRCVLFREGESEGVENWYNQLYNNQLDRPGVLDGFLKSSEFVNGPGATLQASTGMAI